MAKNDEWCDLCDDKLKAEVITYLGREISVCGHCASLAVDERPRKVNT
jgi:ribosome-binding protein aMBF1 (putative translation factor)